MLDVNYLLLDLKKMSDREDMLNGSRTIQRNLSSQSYGEDEEQESQNLLAGDPTDNLNQSDGQQSSTLMRGVKRSLDISSWLRSRGWRNRWNLDLLSHLNDLYFKNVTMDKKLNTVLHKNDNLEKLVKELVSKNNKVRLVCVNIPVCKFSRL